MMDKTTTSAPRAHDPHLSLIAEGIYYWQAVDGKGDYWQSSTPDELRKILESENPPSFRTALARLSDHEDEANYSGPLYLDFDGDLEEILHTVQQKFVPKLKKLGSVHI